MSDDIVTTMQERHSALYAEPDVPPYKFQQFEQDLTELVNDNPDHPALLFQLGTYYMQQERTGAAVALLRASTQHGAVGAAPLLNLAAAYKSGHHDKQAEKFYKDALNEAQKEGDKTTEGHALHGIASLYINRGEPDTAIYWCNRALAVDPDDRFARWNKGIGCLEKGNWTEGFKLYHEAGFVKSKFKAAERKIKTYGGLPQWDGTKGKTVICYGEQGVGDEIMFSSMVPDLMKDCKVIIDCDPRLENLYRESFPDAVAVYPTSSVNDPFEWIKDHPDASATVPMGSLGYWYRKKNSDFPKTPFLTANMDQRMGWREQLAPFKGLKVGISYWGGMKKTRQDQRSIALDRFDSILKTPGCDFFSMQYNPWAADVASKIGGNLNVPIHHWGDTINDWDSMAAFVSELDLIITVNTSLHHLCGALGVEQWCLTPKMCAWRYGVSGDSPFYGNCTMFRQKKPDDWNRVLRDVELELRARANHEVAA